MRKLLLFTTILFSMLSLVFTVVRAQEAPLYGCTLNPRYNGYWGYATDGESTRVVSSQVRVIYDGVNNRLVLRDRETHQLVKILEDSLDTPEFNLMGWTPDCHYIIANLMENGQRVLVGWDTVTGERIHTWAGYGSYGSNLHWNPIEDYVVVEVDDGGYLWYLPTNSQILINPITEYYGSSFHRVEWDLARQQLLTVEIGAGNTVRAYDWHTGVRVGEFSTLTQAAPVNFTLSSDGSLIAVFTSERERRHDQRPSGVAVWNRDSLTAYYLQLQPDTVAAGQRSQVVFSPDNRYLVIGRDEIRVWDLQNLPDSIEDRLPISYAGPDPRIGYVHFVDNTTIETRSVVGFSGTYWLRWNIQTGEYLGYDERP